MAGRILCLGSHELSWMRDRYPSLEPRLATYFAAPLAVDRERLRRVRAARTVNPRGGEPLRYLWIGRWSAHKGTERLSEWLSSPQFGASGARVTLAGCGEPREPRLDALLRNGSVRLVPTFTREELPNLLAAHDAGLFTSLVEGWGLSLQEMLESGLPVHALESGAMKDLRPYLGPLMEPFPPRAPPGGIASIDWGAYESRFDWTQIAREYVATIESVSGVGA